MDIKDTLREAENLAVAQEADEYFAKIKQDAQEPVKQPRQLNVDEERQMQTGFAVEEMTKTAGWSVIAEILAEMPRAHVNPVGMSEQDWKFAELNAFWHGEVAKELQETIIGMIRNAHELQRIQLGEATRAQKMRI